MNDETLKALQGSIEKWEKIVAGTGTDEGNSNCPLCQMFFFKPYYCEGCPVKEKTGKKFCRGTPQKDYERSRLDQKPQDMLKDAQAELDFLKSLLPEATT